MEKTLMILIFSALLGVGISYSSLYLYHIVVFFILIQIAFTVTKNNNSISFFKPNTHMHYLLYIMFGWYFLSIIWVDNHVDYYKYIFYLLCGLFIVTLLFYKISNFDMLKNIYKFSLYIISFEVIVSLLEIFTSFRWFISPFSKYALLFQQKYSFDNSFTEFQYTYLNTLPTGFAWNSNNLALVMLLFFPLFLMFPKKTWFLKIITLLIPIVILLSGSRAGILSFILVTLIFIFIKKRIKVLLISLASLTILFYSIENLDEKFLYKFNEIATLTEILKDTNTNTTNENSINIRRNLINNGLDGLKETYGLGVGAGNSQEIQRQANSKITSMHNFWIEILVESGILFFTIFSIWYVILIYKLFLIYKSKIDNLSQLSLGLSLSLIGFIPGAISASSVIYMLPFWVVLAFSLVAINLSKKEISF